jgi:peptidoglycan pentaglycine glycine transferase (the first glycine)
VSGWRAITDQNEWQTALDTLPGPHALQSWAWGAFKSRWGWSAQRWLLEDTHGPLCALQVLRRAIGPLCALYATKGPTARDTAAYVLGLAQLEQMSRSGRAIWVKVDGDPPVGPTGAWTAGDLDTVRRALAARGWRKSADQVQFRNTMLSDLRADDETLLARMGAKCRYNVRLAERRGVTVRIVRPVQGSDAALLYQLYAETGARDKFTIRERPYYLDAWQAMNATGLIAERAGEVLGGIVLFTQGRRSWYFYGMSSSTGREHMPNHLLQWQAMRWARDNGCDTYDWWGAPEQLVETDGMWGVYRFKESFGAQFVEGVGAWDYAPSGLLYRAYEKVRK